MDKVAMLLEGLELTVYDGSIRVFSIQGDTVEEKVAWLRDAALGLSILSFSDRPQLPFLYIDPECTLDKLRNAYGPLLSNLSGSPRFALTVAREELRRALAEVDVALEDLNADDA